MTAEGAHRPFEAQGKQKCLCHGTEALKARGRQARREKRREMLTLFSTPKPFAGHIEVIQRNALKSWTLLHPDIEIILFGDDKGAAEICRELGLRHEPQAMRNASGTKRLDYIFGRAQEIARHEIVCYINCDILLTHEFVEALRRVRAWRERFLMVGRRWDTDITEAIDFSQAEWAAEIVARARVEGYQRFYHNIDYFLFARGLYAEIPPLVIGRVGWDHWLVGNAYASGAPVVDVSEVVCAVHQNHDYGYHPQGMTGVWNDAEARANWELARRGQRPRTIEDAQWRLTAAGMQANALHWLAPARRRMREIGKGVGGAVRTGVWHPLLNATRPVRRALGLTQEAIPEVLRSKKRRHWMD